ncbi:recombinase family protein [Methylotenera versatilis]|uniref:Recombinase n=1 Tax=Methylotenera versatilis (strain 301) TaxID=666681 RepID=D7DNJ0_METV0|nr:recombinase family protein [Methylotenera versatilis]ADI30991.1 Recombinase [Methylotenera versatilis 301]
MRKAYSYIRMSTNVQLKGDSLRRQLDASEVYAKNNDFELVDSIDGRPLKDIGISGYNGINSQKGVLSVFLDALEKGEIEPNSVLLIESLDRLSRDRLSDALTQFMGILSKGIEIITLTDNQKYTKEIIDKNPGSLYISLGVMFRANEESEIKSKRLKAAWESKRQNANTQKVSKLCPAWLKYSEKTENFELVETKAKIVKTIFDLCISTCGLYGIARYLNENEVPVFGRGKLWHRSYIKKIISNRATIGEFQSFSMVDNKRQPFGDPVKDYFPSVVDEKTFYLANSAITRRDVSEKGRKGISFSNLFTGVVYCGDCGFKMILRNRGIRGGKSLQCGNKQEGGGCKTSDWNFNTFEKIIFNHLLEIDFNSLLNSEASYKDLTYEIEALLEKQSTKEIESQNALDISLTATLSMESKSRVIDKLNSIESEILDIKNQIKKLRNASEEEKENKETLSKESLKRMVEILHEHSDDYFFRSALNQILRRTIDRITLFDHKLAYQAWDIEQDDPVVKQYLREKPNLSMQFEKLVETSNFEIYYKNYYKRLTIKYKTGSVRHLLYGTNASFLSSNFIKKN